MNFIILLSITKGMNIVNPKPPILHENPQGNIESTIRKAYQTAGNAAKKSPQLILCILQGRSSLYDEIKRIEDTILGIPTQVKIIFFVIFSIIEYLLILYLYSVQCQIK